MSDISKALIRQEGDRVILILDGRGYSLPPEAALQMSRVLHAKAKLAEEHIEAERIVSDHALLTRVGVPIGLSNNPKIQDAVRQEAAWNRELRRALPGGVKAPVVFGVPAIGVKKPTQVIAPGGVQPASVFGKF